MIPCRIRVIYTQPFCSTWAIRPLCLLQIQSLATGTSKGQLRLASKGCPRLPLGLKKCSLSPAQLQIQLKASNAKLTQTSLVAQAKTIPLDVIAIAIGPLSALGS